METVNATLIVLSQEEALDLYRFTRNDYINPNVHPALTRLLDRVARYIQEVERTAP